LIKALKYEVKIWGAKELGCTVEFCGLKGSPTSVKTIFAPPPRKGGPVFDTADGMENAVNGLLDTIFQKEAVIMSELFSTDGKVKHA